MKDICIPIPRLESEQSAEVEVKLAGRRKLFNFRVESFPWQQGEPTSPQRNEITTRSIMGLKERIESYDRNWELVQIYNPRPSSKFIQVLFREKNLN